MSRRYALVMRAYPKPYRREHGAELLATASELDDGWSFRQARSLLVEGLRTRARIATNGSPQAAWAQGVAFALGFLLLSTTGFESARLIGFQMNGFEVLATPSPIASILAGLASIAVSISTRWPTAVLAIAAMTLQFVSLAQAEVVGLNLLWSASTLALSVALFCWLAACTDGPRAFSPMVAVLLLGTHVSALVVFGIFFAPTLMALALLLTGLALAVIDPRPLVAATALAAFPIIGNLVVTGVDLVSPNNEDPVVLLVGLGAAAALFLAGLIWLSRFSTRRAFAR